MFGNKILLITGGTGTFGNAVLRRFLNACGRKALGDRLGAIGKR